MYLYFLGESGIRGQDQDLSFLIDPPLKEDTGLNTTRTKSKIAIFTKPAKAGLFDLFAEQDHAMLIDGPGEYEKAGFVIYGVCLGKKITNYVLEWDGVTYAHLGNFDGDLPQESLEFFEGVDVLIIPVGGNGVLSPKKAHEIVAAIEPRLVIPIQYKLPNLKIPREDITVFLKEFGGQALGSQPKIKISKKELPSSESTKVVLLEV